MPEEMRPNEYLDDYLKKNGLDGLNELLALGVCHKVSERQILSLQDLAVFVCSSSKCDNCPVKIYNCDTSDVEEIYNPCWRVLYDWILEQAQLINNSDKLGGT